ncbi:MAG: DUF924 domain-containing protein [Sphingomonas taxi]|uniref:DUF924 domain-containing protein n=1 Tax=Sphingomonas taxi TaxID=1549858 RepID=A0A2W5NYH7_9SPHN|nr:MAG: DUF924 domain-containing protein [Sphingomonas taxi]
MTKDEVDSAAQSVLDFWFALPSERQFGKDDALDADIRDRFGALRDRVAATGAKEWRDSARHVLAAVILLDQFSRNLFRGQAEAFAADPLARELTERAIERGWDRSLSPAERVFLYMPLMHAEDAAGQARSVAMFEALGIEENLAFARDHAEVFARFGRFPSRNAALGRETTAVEQAYLDAGGGW